MFSMKYESQNTFFIVPILTSCRLDDQMSVALKKVSEQFGLMSLCECSSDRVA